MAGMSDRPPPYQPMDDRSYPSEPPPKYEPPKGNYPSYQSSGSSGSHQGFEGVVTATPVIVVAENRWGPDPQTVYCPYCHAHVTTLTDTEAGAATWITAGLLCLFGCWPCCPVPFCIPDLQDVIHRCRLCGNTLGIYRRLS